ncbi:MAG: aminotransferase class I/II-fold pyridoxal phosphate-dependent enzyme [Rikenellaceae bacterium]|nr:aminotransferase class I/II-fold pyridoxal phosphate-dependent enzyme [Rikenellaceae bacterium]
MTNNRIWLSLAHMGGQEQHYIQEAFDTNWVVPLGPNVDGFEKDLAEYLNENVHITALSAGTAALHLALVMLGVEAGDEVICQSFTFAASANPIVYQGATPVFVDSEADTWNMSPEFLARALAERSALGKKPKAIIPVHLYGMPAKMDEILEIASRFDISVVEDAAEALGSLYKGRKCGTFGKYAALSFNGNKIITTSGGGALVSHTEADHQQAKKLATQARDNAPWYQHSQIGYNYRMSNICAGIGRGQMLVLEEHIHRRREIHALYRNTLGRIEGLEIYTSPYPELESNYWLSCLTIDPATGLTPESLRLALEKENIETRPLWKPMHLQPVFAECPFYGDGTSDRLFATGLCLPSGSSLSDEDIHRVIDAVCALCK